ncbi:MAG TPA: AAA family ATPase, partial [Arachidicoccus sp.]|nr:AAA family ATPase [Arachidicoccus sp.]
KKEFDNFILVNLEINKNIVAKFEEDMSPKQIIQYLETLFNQRIIPGKTLIILDEIQACENPLTSLKYFCEQTPEYHIGGSRIIIRCCGKQK